MTTADTFPGYSPDDLLGPLNDVERENAPERLYVAGARTLLKLGTRVSIVGSRKASAIGLKRARRLARSLAEHGVVVVSGLAEGIDTAAHEAAMAVPNGRTIAVLGTPLDRTYPAKNRALQRRIMEEHLAISQYPVGHPILKGNFPTQPHDGPHHGRHRHRGGRRDERLSIPRMGGASPGSAALHHEVGR
jgi:DNA processing protein